MCFSYDAQPPELPPGRILPTIAGGAAAARLTLTSADGTEFAASIAESSSSSDSAVIVLPDARGLYPFYERLSERFAEVGHHTLAIDYFGRTAGVAIRDDEFDFMPHLLVAEAANIQADIATAVGALRDRTGARTVVTVGFCFGGSNSFLAATNDSLELAGAVGFYGGLDPQTFGMKIPSPVDHAAETKVPVLGLFGGGDESIPQARIDAFDQQLAESGVTHDIHVYPGAPHSFFDRSHGEWKVACADAWERVLDFVDRVSSTVSA